MSIGNNYERFVAYTDDHTVLVEEDVVRFILATDTDIATLPRAAQCNPSNGQQAKFIVNDTTSSFTLTIAVQSGDTSVGNLSLPPGRGVFCISNAQLQWTIIGGAGAGGAGSVVESDFSFSDITTANATSALHGLMPKLTPGVATASQPVTLGATKNLDTLALDALTGNDASFGVDGLAAAQGGAIVVTGGASSTTGNAGGAVSVVGGTPGATGIGGAVSITGGISGASGARNGGAVSVIGGAGDAASTGVGGVATLKGGASGGGATGAGGAVVIAGGASVSTNDAGGAVGVTGGVGKGTGLGGAIIIAGGLGGLTNAVGGLASVTAGAGQGTGAGAVASLVGGASGAGATGKGGAAKVTGGAALSTNDDGGGAVIAGGAKNGTGFIGPVVLGNAQLMPIWYPQAAPASDGGDTPFTATVAQMIAGLLSMTPTTGRTITLPTGTQMDAGVAFADVPATFGFDFSVQNRAAFAATDDIITIAAGASGMTVTGSATVAPGVTARFRAVRTGTTTWIIYKIAG